MNHAVKRLLRHHNVTPVQLASLAAQMACSEKEQRNAEDCLEDATRLIVKSALNLLHDTTEYNLAIAALREISAPEAPDMDFDEMLRSFPGGDEITPPKKYPAAFSSVLKCISGSNDPRTWARIIDAYNRSCYREAKRSDPTKQELLGWEQRKDPKDFGADTERVFWEHAMVLTPFRRHRKKPPTK